MMLQPAALVCAFALSAAQIKTIDATVTQVLVRQHIAGLSLGIARNGMQAYVRGYGSRDIGARRPVDAATLFQIGSLTKQFTAAAILLAQNDGLVDLQAPLSRYVPEYKNAAAVSVQQLLDQTSGIPDYSADPSFEGWMNARETPQEVLAHVASAPLHFVPGAQYEYSNTNYLLLGMILERTTKRPFGQFLDERIFAPLGMRATSYGGRAGADVARGYEWNGKAFLPYEERATSVAFSAGGVVSNVPDILAWQAALYGGRALPPEATRRMTAGTAGYAFGLEYRRIYGRNVAGHTGNLPGFASYAATLPQTGLQIVLLANSSGDLEPLGKSLIGILAPPLDGGEDPAETALVARAAGAAEHLRPYGAPLSFTFLDRRKTAGGTVVRYCIAFERERVVATFWVTASRAVLLYDERAG